VKSTEENFESNKDFKKDLNNVLVGIIAQTAITVLPVFLVIMEYRNAFITVFILGISIAFLWRNWYKKLPAS
jgi:UDP-N-acetylmuramyl pentapeptide phosphotransferase/UDP-N-acetylglucosamine-1-phosphate transferase